MSDISEMLKLARSQGFIDYFDFKKYLPKEITDQDQIKDIIELLEDMGFEVRFHKAEVLDINLSACLKDMMVKVDENWRIYDPDGVLELPLKSINTNSVGFTRQVHPREDLLQFKRFTSSIIVDVGYYGNRDELDGNWVANVIDTNIDDPWENPVEQFFYKYTEFKATLMCVKNLVAKYT